MNHNVVGWFEIYVQAMPRAKAFYAGVLQTQLEDAPPNPTFPDMQMAFFAMDTEQLAQRLEVSARTVYRDIQDLSLCGVPIEGETGVGYHLRYSLDIPPLMFTQADIEALVLGARMLKVWGGAELRAGAQSVLDKVQAVMPAE